MAFRRSIAILAIVLLSGCTSENRKSVWISDALASVKAGDYPRIKAINYWHENWENSIWSTSYLRLDSSPEALEAYQEGVRGSFFVTEIVLTDSLKIAAPEYGVYHCAFPDFGNTEDTVSAERISDFETLVEKDLAWVTFSNNWVDGIDFPGEDVDIIWNSGSVPYVRMMAFSVHEYSEGAPDSVYTLQKIIDGAFDEDLTQWAQDAKASGIPMMVCFGVEVNGEWFPWNGSWNGGDTTGQYGNPFEEDGPERFKDVYQHIVNIFRTQEVNNVTWMYHVNASSHPEVDWNTMASYYPGDEYVDWIGISVYGPTSRKEARQYWETFTELMDLYYPELAALSPDKPLAVVEFGVSE